MREPLRILICDDEPLAIARLRSLLERLGEASDLVETSSGRDAIVQTMQTRPDLVLIDIDMPDLDGFDVAEALGRDAHDPPLVAFVTAFKRFAPKAFDIRAIDFLTKPVRMSRLEDTLCRARQTIDGLAARRRLDELHRVGGDAPASVDEYRDAHVWVPRRGEVVRVDLDQLERIDAEGAYVRLNSPLGSLLHREPIGSIESRLDPERFVRVHRSHVVRIDQIQSIRRTPHGSSELILRSGERLPIGRKYAKTARRRVLSGQIDAPHASDECP